MHDDVEELDQVELDRLHATGACRSQDRKKVWTLTPPSLLSVLYNTYKFVLSLSFGLLPLI